MQDRTEILVPTDCLVVFQSIEGFELRATIMRLARHSAVFEIYGAGVILRLSEVLNEFKILINDRPVYSGRAVVSNLIPTNTVTVCEASLEESWVDVDLFSAENRKVQLQSNLEQFLSTAQKTYKILPEVKLLVADMQFLLMELRVWLDQIELAVRSQPSGDRQQYERTILQELQAVLLPILKGLFERFEVASQKIDSDLRPVHCSYVKRQLHPHVLCAPFMYRTFQKPLGYAGDYEMINMMVRDPYEGGSVFAKVLNTYFLSTAPVEAHRNRIGYLKERLIEETCKVVRSGRIAQIFNLGCGPAKEIQEFLSQSELSKNVRFTLLDFNEETLMYTGKILNEIAHKHHRNTSIKTLRKSVAQILKEAAKPVSSFSTAGYDFVYCAGLFDYMPQFVCEKLTNILYDLVLPGGLLVITNVAPSNPSRNWMEYAVDWHLVYRDHQQMAKLCPQRAALEDCRVRSEMTGTNILMEVRKPEHA